MIFVNVNMPDLKEGQKAVGGKVINNGEDIVVAIKNGKNFIIKVIPALSDAIGEVIETTTPLFKELIKLFEWLFRRLPTHIDYHGNMYRLTMQPAYGIEMHDKVFYLIETPIENTDSILFSTDAPQLIGAKNKMRNLLKSKQLIY